MIKEIKVIDKKIKDILLFEEVKNVKKLNILFGGNGVGKTTFLQAIRDGKIELCCDKKLHILSYTNSIDNAKINRKKELVTSRDFVKAYNVNHYSEGQSIIHYILSFLHDIKEIETDKQIVVLLDEMDSGLSAENINMLLWQIKELMDHQHVQFFISTNHYHFVHVVKEVLNLYNGTYQRIESYEKYFELLNDGIQVMNNSLKREFDFLNVY